MQPSQPFEDLCHLIKWIDELTAGLTLPGDRRTSISAACMDVALEHQGAIVLLYQSQLYGSTLALLRLLAEAVTRGMWLHSCATEDQLNRYLKDKFDKTFNDMVLEVEAQMNVTGGFLSSMKQSFWKDLNAFTHTGFGQVSRRYSNGRIEGNYSHQDLKIALHLAGSLGLLGANHLVAMAQRTDLLSSVRERMLTWSAAA